MWEWGVGSCICCADVSHPTAAFAPLLFLSSPTPTPPTRRLCVFGRGKNAWCGAPCQLCRAAVSRLRRPPRVLGCGRCPRTTSGHTAMCRAAARHLPRQSGQAADGGTSSAQRLPQTTHPPPLVCGGVVCRGGKCGGGEARAEGSSSALLLSSQAPCDSHQRGHFLGGVPPTYLIHLVLKTTHTYNMYTSLCCNAYTQSAPRQPLPGPHTPFRGRPRGGGWRRGGGSRRTACQRSPPLWPPRPLRRLPSPTPPLAASGDHPPAHASAEPCLPHAPSFGREQHLTAPAPSPSFLPPPLLPPTPPPCPPPSSRPALPPTRPPSPVPITMGGNPIDKAAHTLFTLAHPGRAAKIKMTQASPSPVRKAVHIKRAVQHLKQVLK